MKNNSHLFQNTHRFTPIFLPFTSHIARSGPRGSGRRGLTYAAASCVQKGGEVFIKGQERREASANYGEKYQTFHIHTSHTKEGGVSRPQNNYCFAL